MSALVVGDYGSAESIFFPFAICALFDGHRLHAYDFVNFLRSSRLQRNAVSSHTRFLPNLFKFYCLSLGLTPSRRHTHSNLFIKTNRKIHPKKRDYVCDAHCSAQSIRIRDIRRMDTHCILLSLIANATHFIIRCDCQFLLNIAVAQNSRLTTVLAIYFIVKN